VASGAIERGPAPFGGGCPAAEKERKVKRRKKQEFKKKRKQGEQKRKG